MVGKALHQQIEGAAHLFFKAVAQRLDIDAEDHVADGVALRHFNLVDTDFALADFLVGLARDGEVLVAETALLGIDDRGEVGKRVLGDVAEERIAGCVLRLTVLPGTIRRGMGGIELEEGGADIVVHGFESLVLQIVAEQSVADAHGNHIAVVARLRIEVRLEVGGFRIRHRRERREEIGAGGTGVPEGAFRTFTAHRAGVARGVASAEGAVFFVEVREVVDAVFRIVDEFAPGRERRSAAGTPFVTGEYAAARVGAAHTSTTFPRKTRHVRVSILSLKTFSPDPCRRTTRSRTRTVLHSPFLGEV